MVALTVARLSAHRLWRVRGGIYSHPKLQKTMKGATWLQRSERKGQGEKKSGNMAAFFYQEYANRCMQEGYNSGMWISSSGTTVHANVLIVHFARRICHMPGWARPRRDPASLSPRAAPVFLCADPAEVPQDLWVSLCCEVPAEAENNRNIVKSFKFMSGRRKTRAGFDVSVKISTTHFKCFHLVRFLSFPFSSS